MIVVENVYLWHRVVFFFFQAEDGIRDIGVTGVQRCALPILRKEFMLAMGRKGFPEKDMNAALDRMKRSYARMDAAITESGGPWLMGKDITLADISVMPAIVRMADLGLVTMWKDIPRLQRWYEAIRAHPAFTPTYYYGSLLTERFPHLREQAKANS